MHVLTASVVEKNTLNLVHVDKEKILIFGQSS